MTFKSTNCACQAIWYFIQVLSRKFNSSDLNHGREGDTICAYSFKKSKTLVVVMSSLLVGGLGLSQAQSPHQISVRAAQSEHTN